MQCYVAAVPFYRWMLAGDVCYLVALFGCLALAGLMTPTAKPVTARIHAEQQRH
jgi:hypothetical protein